MRAGSWTDSELAAWIARHVASMCASPASGRREAAIDQSESPGATVIEVGAAGASGAGASSVGAGSAAVAVCVAYWLGEGVLGVSAHVTETAGEVCS